MKPITNLNDDAKRVLTDTGFYGGFRRSTDNENDGVHNIKWTIYEAVTTDATWTCGHGHLVAQIRIDGNDERLNTRLFFKEGGSAAYKIDQSQQSMTLKDIEPWLRSMMEKYTVWATSPAYDATTLSLYDRIKAKEFDPTVPYPQMSRQHEDYQEAMALYRASEGDGMNRFQAACEKECGVENNPKKDSLFSKAYEKGHSGGFSEIWGQYQDLVDLIK